MLCNKLDCQKYKNQLLPLKITSSAVVGGRAVDVVHRGAAVVVGGGDANYNL